MNIDEVIQLINGTALFLTFENGTCVVYDDFEYENHDSPKPEFSGHYDDCIAYIKKRDRELAYEMWF